MLTPAEKETLKAIKENMNNDITMGDIAKGLGICTARMTNVVKSLENKGYISKIKVKIKHKIKILKNVK